MHNEQDLLISQYEIIPHRLTSKNQSLDQTFLEATKIFFAHI